MMRSSYLADRYGRLAVCLEIEHRRTFQDMLLLQGRRDKPQRVSLQSSLRLAEEWVRGEWMVGRVENEELSFLNLWKETVWGPCLVLAYLFQKRIWGGGGMVVVFIGTGEVLLVLWDDGVSPELSDAHWQRSKGCITVNWIDRLLLSEWLNDWPLLLLLSVWSPSACWFHSTLFFCCWQCEKAVKRQGFIQIEL